MTRNGTMQSIRAADILAHKPPFLFIDKVFLSGEVHATASIPKNPPSAKWAASPQLSMLPAEYAAQVMGVLMRTRPGIPGGSGMLAKISRFVWHTPDRSLECLELQYDETQGAFHSFTARFLNQPGQVCAQMSGTIHLSEKKIAPATHPTDFPLDAPIYDMAGIEHHGNQIRACFHMRRDCLVYAGHFPGRPITPGVLTAEMMLAAATHERRNMGLRRIDDLVFASPLSPGDTVDLKLQQISAGRYSATLKRGGKRVARARLEIVQMPFACASPRSFDLISV